jgi:hypothetical protein
MARRSTADPDTTNHQCCVSFAFVDPRTTVPRVVKAGEIIAPDDPALGHVPAFFCEVGEAHAARPHVSDFILPGVQSEHRPIPDSYRRDVHGPLPD